MNNKILKTAAIAVACVLVFGMAIYVGTHFGTSRGPDKSSAATEAAPSGGGAVSTLPGLSTTPGGANTEESLAPVDVRTGSLLRVGYAGFDRLFNPYYASRTGDLDVVNLLTLDRTGNIIYRATNGETIEYNGSSYTYRGIADLSVNYDSATNITTYDIKLRDDVYFSDGVNMTIDDVIFNYYVYLSPNFTGKTALRSHDIVGLTNYYYNSSVAESLSVTREELDAALSAPTGELEQYIRNLIAETLRDERDMCRNTWQQYQSSGYGNSAQEFFYKLYGTDINYNPLDKDLDTVCEDVIDSYGLNYKLLADRYAVNASYFDEEIEAYASDILLYRKITETPGDPVDFISGIVRLDDYHMQLQLYGYEADAIYDVCNLYIAPLHYYGDKEQYNYEAHRFGVGKEGLTMTIGQESMPVGAGPYRFVEYKNNDVYLQRNEYYFLGLAEIENIVMRTVQGSLIEAIRNDSIDVGELRSSKESYELIKSCNLNESIVGDVIIANKYEYRGYGYIGINAETVSVGQNADSDASKALRKALATVLAVYRETTLKEYFGEAATVIEYPISSGSWASPKPGDASYETAFARDADGNPLYPEQMLDEDRYAAALSAATGYLQRAGYGWDDAQKKFVSAPSGASLRYEILYYAEGEEHPCYEMLDKAKAALYTIGITLDVRKIAEESDMWISISTGQAQLWCANWNASIDPDYESRYHGSNIGNGTGYNFYRIDDEELNSLLRTIAVTDDRTEKKELYRRCMAIIADWAVELPCYQRQSCVLYSAARIDESSIPQDLTSFYSWVDEAVTMKMK